MKKIALLLITIIFLNFQSASPAYAQADICSQAGAGAGDCTACLGGGGIWTGLGCISYSPEGFVSSLLTLGVSLAGGFALLLLIYGAFLLATSAGNPEQVQKGKEVMSSAVVGLLFIIFSVVILNIISVDILGIPDF